MLKCTITMSGLSPRELDAVNAQISGYACREGKEGLRDHEVKKDSGDSLGFTVHLELDAETNCSEKRAILNAVTGVVEKNTEHLRAVAL